MWNWDYEEEGTNIRDGVRGTVTGGCSKGMHYRAEFSPIDARDENA